jgi:hypothetical protein
MARRPLPPGTLAGHTFNHSGICECGMRRSVLMSRRDEWIVGEVGIAHVGKLSQREKDQLEAWIEHVWDAIQESSGHPVRRSGSDPDDGEDTSEAA